MMICRNKLGDNLNSDDLGYFIKYVLNSKSSIPDVTLPKLNCFTEPIFLPTINKIKSHCIKDQLEHKELISTDQNTGGLFKNLNCRDFYYEAGNIFSPFSKKLIREKPFQKQKKFSIDCTLKNNLRSVSPFRERTCLACKKNTQGNNMLTREKRSMNDNHKSIINNHSFIRIPNCSLSTNNQMKFWEIESPYKSNFISKYNLFKKEEPILNESSNNIKNSIFKYCPSNISSLNKNVTFNIECLSKKAFELHVSKNKGEKINQKKTHDFPNKNKWIDLVNTEPINKGSLSSLIKIERLSI